MVNQAILEVDPDLRISPLEKALDLTEECFVHGLAVVTWVAFVRVISKNVETMIVVEIDQFVRKPVEREAHIVKPVRQLLVDVVQIAAARGRVRSDELKIGPPDFLIKLQVWGAAPAAMLGVLVKDSAHEKRVVADVRTEEETLLRGRSGQRDQHVGNVFPVRLVSE